MNRLSLLIILALGEASQAADIFVSPNGDDLNGSGTELAPYKTLTKAVSVVSAGSVIYMRGGTYYESESIVIQTNGNANSEIKVFAYQGETPALNFSAMEENSSNRGVVLDGDYWHFRGIIIEQAGDNGMLLAGNNNTIENCIFRKNRDSGLQLSRYNTDADNISEWPSNNLILSCDAYDNCDSDNEDADGFAPKLTCGEGNIFRSCISHHNIDDGWDMYSKSETGAIGVITLENCIAHNNGVLTDGNTSGSGDKNGFKLGSSATLTNHIIRRCIAFKNGKHGFTDNGNISSIEFTNCTSWNNEDYNFHTRDDASHIFKNNVSFDGGHADRIVGNASAPNALTDEDFSWSHTASASDFVTMTPGPDSDPTSNGFLTPASGSDLIDGGVATNGITYSGSAPDLGAIETGMTAKTTQKIANNKTFNEGIRIGNSSLSVQYTLYKAADVRIQIFTSKGRIIFKSDFHKAAGEHKFSLSKKFLPKGMYLVCIKAGLRQYSVYKAIIN